MKIFFFTILQMLKFFVYNLKMLIMTSIYGAILFETFFYENSICEKPSSVYKVLTYAFYINVQGFMSMLSPVQMKAENS